MVSHPEIPCVLWKRLYCSNKNILRHGLGFGIGSGLPCYLEFCTVNYGSRLLSYNDFFCTSSSSFSVCACVHECIFVHAWMCMCTPWNILSQGGFFKKIYLFLSALGLCCCARAFSSGGERGLLFIAVRGFLIAVASLVAEHGL